MLPRCVVSERLESLKRVAVHTWDNGRTEWRVNGQLHRDDNDQPAVVCADTGAQEWWQHGKWHRANSKPAVIWPDGSQEWWVHGKRRRGDGHSAVFIGADGMEEHWVAGRETSLRFALVFCSSATTADCGKGNPLLCPVLADVDRMCTAAPLLHIVSEYGILVALFL